MDPKGRQHGAQIGKNSETLQVEIDRRFRCLSKVIQNRKNRSKVRLLAKCGQKGVHSVSDFWQRGPQGQPFSRALVLVEIKKEAKRLVRTVELRKEDELVSRNCLSGHGALRTRSRPEARRI